MPLQGARRSPHSRWHVLGSCTRHATGPVGGCVVGLVDLVEWGREWGRGGICSICSSRGSS
jgi:hypothetical protein